jgi:S1-C subfamily serine protease
VITNFHVVEGATEITVTTSDRKVFPASLVGQHPKSDLAVLRIEGANLPYLKLADSDLAEPGSWVLAVGNPLGLTSTVTAGIISAKGRSISLLNDLDAIESFLQTDAAVNPGNSGGPLVTTDGKLLGINTAIATKTGRFQGYSFAIPINLVQRIVDDIIEFGVYRRAFLGVEISTYTRSDRQRLRLPQRTEGVVIDAIFAGGSAAAAGLQVDDLIIRVGKRTIRDLPELTELIGRAKVGEKLKLTVVRNETELEVIVPMLAED